MMKQGKTRSKLVPLLLLLFGVLFLFSAFMVLKIVANGQREQQAFDELAESIAATPENNPASDTQTESNAAFHTESDASPALSAEPSPYADLKEQNPDFFGWISIEDTKINYPVMHTPDDPEYYLRRDFYGEYSQSGVPFLSASCYEGCGNYLIYGHNMNNGTMFASLLFYADRDYWEKHPTIRFDTLTSSGEYEVMAAFYSKVYSQDDSGVFRYYQYTDLSDFAVFSDYTAQVQETALYDTGVYAEYGDHLLTLSTCSYHTENGRFVVVARKVGS